MPNLASNKKNVRKSSKRRRKNKTVLDKLRRILRENRQLTPTVQKMIDKVAKERVIHPRKAARLKSRMAKTPGAK